MKVHALVFSQRTADFKTDVSDGEDGTPISGSDGILILKKGKLEKEKKQVGKGPKDKQPKVKQPKEQGPKGKKK